MNRRRRRIFTLMDEHELLEAIGECRRACLAAKTKADIHHPVYDACSGLMAAIDDVAAVLTGDRGYFWTKVPPSRAVTPNASDG
jgi:hypothetical protein